MDKNLSSFLRTDAFTIQVKFRNGDKCYTYISTMPLA